MSALPKPFVGLKPAKLSGAKLRRYTGRKVQPEPEIPKTGDVEADASAELVKFREKAAKEAKRREKATDSEYWFCVCFQTREQVEEFLAKSGWGPTDAKYLDGQKVAQAVGVDLTPDTTPYGKVRVDPKWAELSMEV